MINNFRIFSRTALMLSAVAASVFLCGYKLFSIQLESGEDYAEQAKSTAVINTETNAARGQITDINGTVIIGNKTGYNVVIEKAFFPSDLQEGNSIILNAARILTADGKSLCVTLPITEKAPYKYTGSNTEKLTDILGLERTASAAECINKLISDYKISSDYSEPEKRLIAAIRYEMSIRDFSLKNRYTLAENISIDTVTKIKELSLEFKGVKIAEEATRYIARGDVIPHIIGTTGPIFAEEFDELKAKGYSVNDTIGKSGIEKSMEEYLKGEKGEQTLNICSVEVVSSETLKNPVAGNSLKLTIDIEFQKKVQKILENFILHLNKAYPEYRNVKCGAIVVLNAKTGAVLAIATAPTYNLNDYKQNYPKLVEDESLPLLNRAANGLYRPGSTFKTVTAAAGLNEGIVTPNTTYKCRKKYTYMGTTMGCLGWHGNISVRRALKVSCNSYFYELGKNLGIDQLDKYAAYHGLGQDLGLEFSSSKGRLASPETLKELGMDWTPGQVLQASIGQSETAVTPLQMAVQAMTAANNGVRYRPYIVDSVYSYNMDRQISKTETEIASQVPLKNEKVYETIREGMVLVSKTLPSGRYSLKNIGMDVAIKTGSPQSSRGFDSTVIGFAPADNPEIAFSAIIEGGDYSKYMVRKIIDAYFQ